MTHLNGSGFPQAALQAPLLSVPSPAAHPKPAYFCRASIQLPRQRPHDLLASGLCSGCVPLPELLPLLHSATASSSQRLTVQTRKEANSSPHTPATSVKSNRFGSSASTQHIGLWLRKLREENRGKFILIVDKLANKICLHTSF